MLWKFSTKMFAGLGFHVEQACDGQEALAKMKSTSYTVVLMDQNMPHLDGLGAVRKFREWQSGGDARASYDDSKGSEEALDRKSFVEGKSVSVRVDLGGRRIIKKKKYK